MFAFLNSGRERERNEAAAAGECKGGDEGVSSLSHFFPFFLFLSFFLSFFLLALPLHSYSPPSPRDAARALAHEQADSGGSGSGGSGGVRSMVSEHRASKQSGSERRRLAKRKKKEIRAGDPSLSLFGALRAFSRQTNVAGRVEQRLRHRER